MTVITERDLRHGIGTPSRYHRQAYAENARGLGPLVTAVAQRIFRSVTGEPPPWDTASRLLAGRVARSVRIQGTAPSRLAASPFSGAVSERTWNPGSSFPKTNFRMFWWNNP